MAGFEKVLVLAGWPDKEPPALARAFEAAAPGGALHVLDVVYVSALEGYMGNTEIYEPLRRRVLDERRDAARALAARAAARGFAASAEAVWDHPFAEAVAHRALEGGAGLVVAAPALESAGAGLAHSDWQLVLQCPAPTLIVKSNAAVPYRHVVAAVDPFHTHAKPAGLDEAILRNARALADAAQARLTALHCHVPLGYFGADLASGAGTVAEPSVQLSAELGALVRRAGVTVDAARVVAGAPETVLEAMSRAGDADVIVMGALKRGRLTELIVGHTAERVLHHVSSDVMVVKHSPT